MVSGQPLCHQTSGGVKTAGARWHDDGHPSTHPSICQSTHRIATRAHGRHACSRSHGLIGNTSLCMYVTAAGKWWLHARMVVVHIASAAPDGCGQASRGAPPPPTHTHLGALVLLVLPFWLARFGALWYSLPGIFCCPIGRV